MQLATLFAWYQMANYCDSPFDGDTNTHDINLLNELELQIFMASITLETATNKPEGNEPKKEILPHQHIYRNRCQRFWEYVYRKICIRNHASN